MVVCIMVYSLHNIQHEQDLNEFRQTLRKTDRLGKSLRLYPPTMLRAFALNADTESIITALEEIESYKKPISSIVNLFKARFVKGEDGIGRLKSDRQGIFGEYKHKHDIPKVKRETPRETAEPPAWVTIRPSECYDHRRIDTCLDDLCIGRSVERGEIPPGLKESDALVYDPDGIHCRLHPLARLTRYVGSNFRLAGYWYLQWLPAERTANIEGETCNNKERQKRRGGKPTSIQDALPAKLLAHHASNN